MKLLALAGIIAWLWIALADGVFRPNSTPAYLLVAERETRNVSIRGERAASVHPHALSEFCAEGRLQCEASLVAAGFDIVRSVINDLILDADGRFYEGGPMYSFTIFAERPREVFKMTQLMPPTDGLVVGARIGGGLDYFYYQKPFGSPGAK